MTKKESASSDNLLNDYHLLSYDAVDSTNEEAKRLAAGGGSHGAVIWAKQQTNGRGRMGREWVSPDGNLYVSILLEPKCEEEDAGQLSFVAAVAAQEALAPVVPDSAVTLKWPNDILLDGKKVGGILLESFHAPDSDNSHKLHKWLVVGVGINIESYPDKTLYPATCLKEAGVEIISAKIVLSRFVYNFITQYDLWRKKGFAPVRKAWLAHAHGVGDKIEVRLPKEQFSGVFTGIDKQGMLQITVAGNKKRTVAAGDVFFKSA